MKRIITKFELKSETWWVLHKAEFVISAGPPENTYGVWCDLCWTVFRLLFCDLYFVVCLLCVFFSLFSTYLFASLLQLDKFFKISSFHVFTLINTYSVWSSLIWNKNHIDFKTNNTVRSSISHTIQVCQHFWKRRF